MSSPRFFVSGVAVLSVVAHLARAGEPALPGNVAQGDALFRQSCAVCHAAGPGTAGGQGPSLAGIFGKRAATNAVFPYTRALIDSGVVWDAASLDRYLTNPTLAIPGTNMVVIVPKPEDRRDIIAFLATLKPSTETASPAPVANASASDTHDWRHAQPGVKHLISADRLPAPFETPSARNNPATVAAPFGASLAVPAGFTVELFARGLNGPRLIHTAPNGDIFVAETRANRIRVLRATDGAATPSVNELFADGLDRPFGMAFHPAGNDPQWVYFANNNSIVRFPYRNGDLKARGPAETIVAKFSDTTNGHSTRDLAFSPDGRRMFIAVGSGSNVAENVPRKSLDDARAWDAQHGRGAMWGAEFHRANILVTDPEGRAPLKIFASGIRNPVGLAIEPVTGELWTSTNERDALGDDLVPDYVSRIRENGFYGWPWYYLGNHEDPRHAGARPDLAGQATVPDVLIQSHSAALGIAFYNATSGAAVFPADYRGDLFVALHGSWNRASRTGYKVIRVKLQNGRPTGEYEDFLTGFVVDQRAVWGRPVGVAVAHDGALLVSEDGNGTIWRVAGPRR
jgi:glucose/arabinose dehydrogenase